MRAGARALSLLATPLNVHVLTSLAEGPLALIDLRRAVGSPPQTTLRGHLRAFSDLGIVIRQRQDGFPGSVDYELTCAGRGLLEVLGVLDAWLHDAPEGPIEPASVGGRSSIKALADGWSTRIVRALAGRPLSLTELNLLISNVTYPTLERRLGAMRLSGQVEARPSVGRGTPYAATEWLRRSLAPTVSALRWEREHLGDRMTPVGRIDAESIFLLAVPLLQLSPALDGSCRLAVEFRGPNGEYRPAGALIKIARGQVVSCVSRLEGDASAWVTGSTTGWLDALIDAETRGLEIGGDGELAKDVIEGLHAALFPVPLRSTPS